MGNGVKKWLRVALGCVALVIGLVGLVAPFLPGWLLIGVGMLLLSPQVPLFERWLQQLEERLPASRPHLRRMRRWLD